MRKLALTAVVVAFVAACAHKTTTPQNQTNATPPPTQTKDQAPADKHHHHHHKTSDSTASAADSVKCKNGSDERTLEISEKDGGCDLTYTKAGEAKSIASSSHGKQHCQDVSEKIQKKLGDAGFTCQ